ncbi:MAG: hypothetical protein LC103_03375 [Anaerolineales bacterium]|nr:hypothetical protein [Anaerolineales bacterium]
MQSFFDLEFLRQFNNLLIIALGVLAIVFILRGVFKVAWKVIKVIFIVLGLLVLLGWLFGYIHISLV